MRGTGLALLLAACRAPGPRVIAAREVSLLPPPALIQGRDGGGSARAFGVSVFTYGDTVLNEDDVDGQNWHHNSVSWTSDGDASDGITGVVTPLDAAGAPAYLVPPSPDERAFNDAHWGDQCAVHPCGARWAVWPGTPVWDAARHRALVFYGLIYAERGAFNFESVGESIGTWTNLHQPVQRPIVDPYVAHPDLIWTQDEPGFGAAAAIDGDDLYAFSCDEPGPGNPCRLARAPLDHVQVRSAWRYWDGHGWQDDWKHAVKLFEGAPILEVSFVPYLDAWMAVYSRPFSHRILARTAPALTGPWSRETLLYTVAGDPPYDAVNHPEYAEDDGRVQYITWSRPTTGWFGSEFVLLRVELR